MLAISARYVGARRPAATADHACRARRPPRARYETEDGQVRIVRDGHELSARTFHKEGHVRQAAIVENKPLGAALQYAKRMQQERDAKKLQSKSVTNNDGETETEGETNRFSASGARTAERSSRWARIAG